ncbi:hypothetical protein QYF68_02930 [Mycolicibacterium austroafricanum]|nr:MULTISPECIES: hypothetical protein [Mycolicibacterium]MCV7155785.1 hypothetical protein [Mycolicibacterium pyrenivorans]MDN4516776.1 hypothetical protein [Mycolicibacterium austroafricanum]
MGAQNGLRHRKKPRRAGSESGKEVSTVMAAYGEGWLAVVIGAALLLVLLVAIVAAALRARRRRHDATAVARCWGLIAEALVVRQRVSGQIDAATYQARMNDLVAGGRR